MDTLSTHPAPGTDTPPVLSCGGESSCASLHPIQLSARSTCAPASHTCLQRLGAVPACLDMGAAAAVVACRGRRNSHRVRVHAACPAHRNNMHDINMGLQFSHTEVMTRHVLRTTSFQPDQARWQPSESVALSCTGIRVAQPCGL